MDLYRLGSGAELDDLDLDGLLDAGAVAVEWGDRLPGSEGAVRVIIESVDECRRRLAVDGGSSRWSS